MSFYRHVTLLVLLLIPVLSYPAIWHVPVDYPTIQAAVDAAGNGDTILIADGVYSGPGNISIQWDATIKHLVIMSENGRDHCIIDCMEEERGFFLNMGQDPRDVIDGLTIINGYGGGNAGGAILIDSASPVIQGNIIRGNYSGGGGGGISFEKGASGVVENNIIDSNETHSDGGGIALEHNSTPLIINNLIINNFSRGHYGGGIYTYMSNPSIINNTIAYNTTYIEYFPGQGGGIGIEGEPYPLIRNCIIWNNISSSYTMNIHFPPLTWMDISYCNVEDDLDHIFDLKPYTNIDSLPGFMDPENGNFQLLGNSPCINMGTPDTTGLFLPPKDLSGNDRILEGRVDIGAYENNRPTTTLPMMEGTDIHVYPNPCSGLLVLEYREESEHDDLMVRISNVRGEMVKEEKIDAAKKLIPVDISNQPDGIYVLTLTSGQSVLFRQKIIKE